MKKGSVTGTVIKIVLCCAFFVFFVSLPSQAGFFYGKQKFYTVKTEHFNIHFAEGLGPIAEEMKTLAEDAFSNITSRLEWRPRGRTHLVLTDKTDQANGLATVMPYNYILLYVATPDGDSSLDNYKSYLKLLINHEFTHIAHIDMHYRLTSPFRMLFGKVIAPNGATPPWMREGMAVYEESQLDAGFGRNNSAYTDMVLRSSILENKFPRIDQIAGLSAHFPAGNGPYAFGSRFFQWLGETYGEDRMYKYQKETASSLWSLSLNNKARRVYGKSFYKLWDEFKADLQNRYAAVKTYVESAGVTPLDNVVSNNDSQRYYIPYPFGDGYAYFNSSLDEASSIIIKAPMPSDWATSMAQLVKKDAPMPPQVDKVIKKNLFGQLSFSKTGRYLAFSSLASVEKQTSRSEVYYFDFKKNSMYRATDTAHKELSLRATDPDFSPSDGGERWLVMVRSFLGTDQLYIYDILERKGYVVTEEPKNTQLFTPRFSPDGEKIVVSRRDSVTGFRDIVMYSKTGALLEQITNDILPDAHPVFSPDSKTIYYDSYHTGIANIFAYDIESKINQQISNVLDGVFQPMPSPDGQTIFVQRYLNGKTFIQKFSKSTINGNLLKYQLAVEPKFAEGQTIVEGRNYTLVFDKTKPDEPLVLEHTIMPTATDQAEPEKVSITQLPINNEASDDVLELADQNMVNDVPHDVDNSKSIGNVIDSGTMRFSMDPADADLLVKNKKTDKDETANKKTGKYDESGEVVAQKIVEPAKQEFASLYKDVLQDHPQDISLSLDNPADAKKYHAFPQVLKPSYVVPSLLFFENAVLFGAATGKHDPLYRHSWSAFANYRSDAAFIGAGATYIFSQYNPVFYTGYIRYAVDWGDVNGTRFFEQRNQAYGGASFAIKRNKFNVAYFYEDRAALTNLAVNLVNMQPYAGFRAQYSISKYSKYSDSISPENGYSLKIAGEWTNTLFGANGVNEERVIRADARYYFEMPWSNHHVLAFRVASGWVWGDVQQFGVYRLGGPFGEGVGSSYSSRLFPLRGLAGITFGGDRVFIFSSEYRWPLVENVNRGVGTWPIFLDKLSLNFFCDGGDIKYRTELPDLFTRMMVSTGVELQGNFSLGYGVPVMLRTGYAIILTNRDRLGTLTDVTTGASLKYGSIYLQLGTMF